MKSYIEDLQNRNFIRKSKSPFSSSVVCVRKKDGGLRLCVDYTGLNQKTAPDRHPIPRIQETLDNVGGNHWFSVQDQRKAYHGQPQSASYSVYNPLGFIRMDQNTVWINERPRQLSEIHGGLFVRPERRYLETIFGQRHRLFKDFTEHVQHLQQVLQQLKSHGVKLKPRNCNLFKDEVSFLGRIMHNQWVPDGPQGH